MLIDRQQFFKHIQKCGTLSNEKSITWYWINWFRQPRYDISAYSNEFGKFSAMLLPIIVNSFDTTNFPEKLMLFRL
jgi:hypothetical protein